jgi:hypothetical protein
MLSGLAKWSSGQVVKWSSGQVVKWSSGQVVKWSSGQVVPSLTAKSGDREIESRLGIRVVGFKI